MRRLAAIAAFAVAAGSGGVAAAGTGSGTLNSGLSGGTSGSTGVSVISIGVSGGVLESTALMQVKFSGDVVVTFRGDRAAGCAARGLCGYSGTVVWAPPARGELVINKLRFGHHRVYQLVLLADPAQAQAGVATARVHGPSPSVVCADAAPAAQELAIPTHDAMATFSVKGAYPSLTETRCAGPLNPDYAAGLISRSVEVRRLLGGYIAINLTSSGTFATHGFGGSVRSTVALRLGRAHVTKPQPPGTRGGRTVRQRTVDVAYRLNVVGDVIERLHGAPRSCGLLGSCGLAGSAVLHLHELGVRGDLFAQTSVRRPYRDVLTALGLRRGGDPKGILALGVVTLSRAADVHAALGICTDAVRTDAGSLALAVSRGSLRAGYENAGDAFHTHCPGPLVDVYELATGGAPRGALASRTTTFTITHGIAIRDDGYGGEIVPHLRVTLTRVRITSRVVSYRVG